MFNKLLSLPGFRMLSVLILLILISVPPAFSQESAPTQNQPIDTQQARDPLLGWTFTPGIGVRVVTLNIRQKSTGNSGILTNDGSFLEPIYLSFNVETPGWMVTDTVGFSIRSSAQTFTVTRQQIPSATTQSGHDFANLGTSARGYYSYIGPTLFYRLMEKGGDLRFGLGYGYWKAWFSGDIILAPGGAATKGMQKTRIDSLIDGNTGPIFFVQGSVKNYTFEIAISSVQFSNAEFETDMRELGMSVGYRLTF